MSLGEEKWMWNTILPLRGPRYPSETHPARYVNISPTAVVKNSLPPLRNNGKFR